jgi:hypothetical protein
VLKAAKQRRVTFQIAREIVDKLAYKPPPLELPPPIEPPPLDDEPPPDAAGPDDGDTLEQQWQRSLGEIAGHIIALESFWINNFEGWEKFEAPSDLVTLVKQATTAWIEAEAKIIRSAKSPKVLAAAERAEARTKVKATT